MRGRQDQIILPRGGSRVRPIPTRRRQRRRRRATRRRPVVVLRQGRLHPRQNWREHGVGQVRQQHPDKSRPAVAQPGRKEIAPIAEARRSFGDASDDVRRDQVGCFGIERSRRGRAMDACRVRHLLQRRATGRRPGGDLWPASAALGRRNTKRTLQPYTISIGVLQSVARTRKRCSNFGRHAHFG